MRELVPENVIPYLRELGVLTDDERAEALPLAWGVSNVVMRIVRDAGRPDFVVKQSRGQLRTTAPWFSRLDRIHREIDFMAVISPLLPPGVVPRILFDDRDNYLFGMDAIEANHVVWKGALLAGEFDVAIFEELAKLLARLHASTWKNPGLRENWKDLEVFYQLRIDPFYRHVARVHPGIAVPIEQLIAEIEANRLCAVAADFSPKNILIRAGGKISLVDFETGHFGDPSFDTGFFLSHLLLKSIHHGLAAGDMGRLLVDLAERFQQRYVALLSAALPPSEAGEISASERRGTLHLAACMLARIDGASPVDYLANFPEKRELARQLSLLMMREQPATFNDVFELTRSATGGAN